VSALEGLGVALWEDQNLREALDHLEMVLLQQPRRELALEKAARAAMQLGDTEISLAHWRHLVEVNPYTSEGRAFLAQALAHRREWAAAVDECHASLKLDPFVRWPRMLLIDCLVRLGKQQQAREEFATLLVLSPGEADKLRQWFGNIIPPTH
jgi:tetratricopeptide (TPR) repeat protein